MNTNNEITRVTKGEELTPDEKAELLVREEHYQARWEAEATETFGPPELRVRKNQRYAARLVRKHSEPVIRGILECLSRLERPLCAHWLSETDLKLTPLAEIITPFELCGLHFRVVNSDGTKYTVDISSGYGKSGDGGSFIVLREGSCYTIHDTLSQHVC